MAEGPSSLDPTLPASGPGATPTPLDATVPSTSSARPASLSRGERDLLPAVRRERYEIAGEIAHGGMGRVLDALDVRLGRPVAIKELLVGGPELRARFEREVRITARLQHPAIVALLEAGAWPGGEPFFTMKKVAGRPLDAVIAGAETPHDRLALLPRILDVAHALAYAHGQGIIHRDLKPSNVLVGEYGETVVIDWGLAKDLRASDGARAHGEVTPVPSGARIDATVAGDVLGTPMFMAPEQARGEPVDARADVYALGALLYHLLAGRPPYEAQNAGELLARVKAGPPPPLASRQRDLPPDLLAIVAKAMARDPADRYPSAKELADDLRRFQTGQLVAVHHYTAGQLVRRFVRRHVAAFAVAVVAALVLATGGAYAVARIYHGEQTARRAQAEATREKDAVEAANRDAQSKATTLEEEQGKRLIEDARSQRDLGYAFAHSVRPDPDRELREAVPDEDDACHHGSLSACGLLGTLYLAGQGVARDYGEARALFEKACRGGDVRGCEALGDLYYAGKGVAQDYARAFSLYEKACDSGASWNACNSLAAMYGNGDGVAKDLREARALFERSCGAGSADGCMNLGAMYVNGWGVAKNPGAARGLYRKACEGGDAEACFFLGELELPSPSLARYPGQAAGGPPGEAADLFQRACDGGVAESCTQLGELVHAGRGVARDPAREAHLFQKACAAQDADGCADLAADYRAGRGVSKDPAKAKALFAEACRGGDKDACGR